MNTPSEQHVHLEQYKLAVEMADRISQRRQQINALFLPAVSVLTVTTALTATAYWFVALTVCVFCWTWRKLILSYKNLTKVKFQVIGEMEKHLPFPVYGREDDLYDPTKQPKHTALSDTERIVPIALALLSLGIATFSQFTN